MSRLAVALSFFTHASPWRWPGLAFYFAGWMLCRCCGLRLFRERVLHLESFRVIGDVEGQSGLVFLHEVLVRRIYDFPALQAARDLGLMYDVGANAGAYTLALCAERPTLRAVSFEPHPATFERLRRNLSLNHFEPRATAVHAAVTAASGQCVLNISPESSMGVVATSDAQCLDAPVGVAVEAVALDDFARRQNTYPDLLKIDVEGFEVEVLKGARACLEHARFVILECHSDSLVRDSLALLHATGFTTDLAGNLVFAHR